MMDFRKRLMSKKENEDLQIRLNTEIEKNQELQKKVLAQESHLKQLEKELAQSGSSVLGLSEQLLAKDTIIKDLEALHNKVLSHNKQMSQLLSFVFSKCGLSVSEEEIEASIATDRMQYISHMLLSGLEEKINSKIVPEDETQTDLSTGPPADSDEKESRPSSGESNSSSQYPNHKYFRNGPMVELFEMLERKRQSLLRMERKIQELGEVESHTNERQMKNQIRISLLETMLISVVNGEYISRE